MPAYFLDSSATVKRYTNEVGTKWVLDLVKPSASNLLLLSGIAGVEVVAALTRQIRGNRLTAANGAKSIKRFERDFANRYVIIAVGDLLIAAAMTLAKKHGLRGYDAVQLAAALYVHNRRQFLGLSALTLVSADSELNSAAQAEGLQFDNPNSHP